MREQVWMGILESDRLGRYYSAIADKARKKHQLLSVGITLAASSALAVFLTQLPEFFAGGFLVSVAFATVWTLYADYSGKAVMADVAANQYRDLSTEWRKLWYSEEITQEKIQEFQRLDNRIAEKYPLNEDDKLAQKAQEDAYGFIPQEFGAQG